MKKRAFLIGIIIAVALAFTSIGFASWGIIGSERDEAEGEFTSFTIINLENISDSAPAFFYNSSGVFSDSGLGLETSFTIQINALPQNEPYDLTISIIDNDNVLVGSTITSNATTIINDSTTNVSSGSSTITIENIQNGGTYYVTYIIQTTNQTYPIIYQNLESAHEDIRLRITAAKADGTWTINKTLTLTTTFQNLRPVSKPTIITNLVYNGSAQSLVNASENGVKYNLNVTTGTNAGSYNIVATLVNGYCWSDNSSTDPYEIVANIAPKPIDINWTNTSVTYNGLPQKPTATATGVLNNDIVNVTVAINGNTAQINAGSYSTVATSIDNNNYTLTGATNINTTFIIHKFTPIITQDSYKAYVGEIITSSLINYTSTGINSAHLDGTLSFPTTLITDIFGNNTTTNTKNLLITSATFTPNDTTNYEIINPEITINVYAVAYIGSKYYGTITSANTNSASGNTIYVIPSLTNQDGSLHTITINEDMLISSGVTLCLPYESTNYANRDGTKDSFADGTTADIAANLKTSVRIASSITITNNGTINIGGILGSNSQGLSGHTSGNYSQIIMGSNAIITNNTSGTINCYGYIKEETLNNGSKLYNHGTIYKPFVVYDYSGGTQTVARFIGNASALSLAALSSTPDGIISPFNIFDMPNIQCEEYGYYDGIIKGLCDLYASSQHNTAEFYAVSKSSNSYKSLFILTNDSSYTKIKFTGNSDGTTTDSCKTKIELFGGCNLGSLSLSVYVNLSIINKTFTVDTATVMLPVSYKIETELNSGTYTLATPIKFLPGSSLKINNGATLNSSTDVIFYDSTYNDSRTHYPYPSGKGSSSLVVNGTLNLNSGKFGGLIQNNSSTAVLTISSSCTLSCSSDEHNGAGSVGTSGVAVSYETITMYGKGYLFNGINSYSLSNFTSGTWNGANGAWYKPGNITINIYDNSNTLIDTCTIQTGQSVSSAFIDTANNKFNKQYYIFEGLYEDIDGTIVFNSSSIFYCNTNIYAKYSPDPSYSFYKINIDVNGGSTSAPSVINIVDDGTTTTYPLPTATREGHSYKWIRTSDNAEFSGGTSYSFDTLFGNSSEITLRAVWTTISYTVKITTSNSTTTVTVGNTTISNNGTIPYGSTVKVVLSYSQTTEKTFSITMTSGGTVVTRYSDSACTQVSTSTEEGTYYFIMPAGNITINSSSKASSGLSCVTAGTLITLENGEQKPVELLEKDDLVLSFNHITGQYEAVPIFMVVNHGHQVWDVIKLIFEDNTELKIIESHGLFDFNTNNYAHINEENYLDYIGHLFAKYNSETGKTEKVRLIDALIIQEETDMMAPFSYGNLNAITNGLISYDTKLFGTYNYFDFDDNMKYNEESMISDIEKYGLYDYNYWQAYITHDTFNAFHFEYFKVAVEKELCTEEDIIGYILWLADLLEEGCVPVSKYLLE